MEYDIYRDVRESFGQFLALGLSIEAAFEAVYDAFGLGVWTSKITQHARAVLDHEVELALERGTDL